MPVQQRGDRRGVGDDAGHVRRRGERADPQWTVVVPVQLDLQSVQVDVAVRVLRDHHDVRDGLAPGQLVGVVLVRADEHDRPLVRRDRAGQVPAVVELRRHPQPEDADHLVDRAGAAGAAEHDDGLLVTAHRVPDDRPGVLAQPGRLQAGAAGLGVRVGVAREDLGADEVLQEPEGPAGRGVVRVRHPARPVRSGHHLVVPDDRLADAAQQRGLRRFVRAVHTGTVSPRRRPVSDFVPSPRWWRSLRPAGHRDHGSNRMTPGTVMQHGITPYYCVIHDRDRR